MPCPRKRGYENQDAFSHPAGSDVAEFLRRRHAHACVGMAHWLIRICSGGVAALDRSLIAATLRDRYKSNPEARKVWFSEAGLSAQEGHFRSKLPLS